MDREPAPIHGTSVYRYPPPPQPHASDMWWQSLETCSNCSLQDPPSTYTPTYADIWWQSLETCSNCSLQDPPTHTHIPTYADIWWLWKHYGLHKRAVHPTRMLFCPLFTYANFWREIQPQLTNKKLIKFRLCSLLLSKNNDECNDFPLRCQTQPINSTSN